MVASSLNHALRAAAFFSAIGIAGLLAVACSDRADDVCDGHLAKVDACPASDPDDYCSGLVCTLCSNSGDDEEGSVIVEGCNNEDAIVDAIEQCGEKSCAEYYECLGASVPACAR